MKDLHLNHDLSNNIKFMKVIFKKLLDLAAKILSEILKLQSIFYRFDCHEECFFSLLVSKIYNL